MNIVHVKQIRAVVLIPILVVCGSAPKTVGDRPASED
jgi:hypothetical protein